MIESLIITQLIMVIKFIVTAIAPKINFKFLR